MSQPLLSILVPTVPSRLDSFYPAMMKNLLHQVGDRTDIEIIGLFDNKIRSVGEKRNALLDLATGKYLCFLDDDDQVTDDWLVAVTGALQQNPDLVVWQVLVHFPDGRQLLCDYDKSTTVCRDIGRNRYRGHPSHVHMWKSEIAKSLRFPDKQFGEDTAWSSVLAKKVVSQIKIPRVLYHYHFNPQTSETRK